ncbi:imidazolonepropionase [Myxococcota bacterium]|nr:imidazolonepropionase [Myxococcota bacterium]MBU1429928.1 imidazolonepropionase [Myxococcota bacterium]
MTPVDLILEGAGEIFTADGPPLKGGALAVAEGRIVALGSLPDDLEISPTARRIDVGGRLITPGLVEAHTHILFAGDRSGEYAMRAAGAGYLEIAAAGGGIAATARATRAASLEALIEGGRARLDRLLGFGVTTVEVKSGYGLSLEAELKMLRAAKALNETHPVDLVMTFLGAHTVPPERRADREGYLREIIDEMIPAVAAEGLAEFCDVFIEAGAFGLEEAERVLRAGIAHGLRPKVHADQLSAGGGAELAARLGAISADHLERISPEGIAALAEAGVVAVLLPGAALFLDDPHRAPARALLDAGVKVALSTDCNPGTCMSEHLPLMGTLGVSQLKMSPTEVMEALTINAAHAIGRQAVAGALAVGRPADIAVFEVPSHHHLPYHFGINHRWRVFKGGVEVA